MSTVRPVDAVVSTRAGAVRGSVEDGTRCFLGVPYAAPPVGRDRWRPPRPHPGWDGVADATVRGPAPPQPERPPSMRFFGPLGRQDEDCLRLHVWAPADAEGARPVLVWVHGGGFVIGGAGSEVFDGAALSRALDAVVVTVGYRLGSLGWLHHPDLAPAPGDPAANWGLQDVVGALRWVHHEIAAFGGDPGRVTAAGESAGAAIVVQLLGAPGAQGLLRRALALSPPLGESTFPSALGARWAEGLVAEAGVASVGALREVGAQQVVEAHERLLADPAFRGTRGGALPMAGEAQLPADPLELTGASPDVPVLVTTNADEATFFFRQPGRVLDPDAATLRRMVAHQPGVGDADEVLARVIAALGTREANELLVRIATEAVFTRPIANWIAGRVAAGGRVHRARIEHRSPQPGFGAVHSVGVPLLFGSHRTATGSWLTGDDARADEVAAALQRAVRGWLHDGDPGWEPVAAGSGAAELTVFGGDGAVTRPGRDLPTLL